MADAKGGVQLLQRGFNAGQFGSFGSRFTNPFTSSVAGPTARLMAWLITWLTRGRTASRVVGLPLHAASPWASAWRDTRISTTPG